jgi:hypothetical protein
MQPHVFDFTASIVRVKKIATRGRIKGKPPIHPSHDVGTILFADGAEETLSLSWQMEKTWS